VEVHASRERAFEEVYRECLPDVRTYAAAHVGRSEVDDIVSSTFMTVWQKFEEAPPLSRRAWVIGVARNHCRNRWRSNRRFASLVDEIVLARPKLEVGLTAAGVDPGALSVVTDLIPDLEAGERELLVLTGWLELSPAEIGEVLGVPAGTVRVRLHRLRAMLAQRLTPGDEGEVTA
jgi:RNA polymerase sigma-70 factor (ECF subfamily)